MEAGWAVGHWGVRDRDLIGLAPDQLDRLMPPRLHVLKSEVRSSSGNKIGKKKAVTEVTVTENKHF